MAMSLRLQNRLTKLHHWFHVVQENWWSSDSLYLEMRHTSYGGLTNTKCADSWTHTLLSILCSSFRSRKYALCSAHVGYISSLSTLNATLASSCKLTEAADTKVSMTSSSVFKSALVDNCRLHEVQLSIWLWPGWPPLITWPSCRVASVNMRFQAPATASESRRPLYLYETVLFFDIDGSKDVSSPSRPIRRPSAPKNVTAWLSVRSKQSLKTRKRPW